MEVSQKKNYSDHFCCSESIVEFLINHFLIAHEFNLFLCLWIQFFYLFMLSHSTCRSLNSTQRKSTQQIVITTSSTSRPRYASTIIYLKGITLKVIKRKTNINWENLVSLRLLVHTSCTFQYRLSSTTKYQSKPRAP